MQEGQLEGVDDICALSIVTEAALLHTVRVRYFRTDLANVGAAIRSPFSTRVECLVVL